MTANTRVARKADLSYTGTVVTPGSVVTLVRWDNGTLVHIPTVSLVEVTTPPATLTPTMVRKALAAIYGKDQITFYRHQSGYYYFSGERGGRIESLITWDLSAWTLDEILQHVAGALRDQENGF